MCFLLWVKFILTNTSLVIIFLKIDTNNITMENNNISTKVKYNELVKHSATIHINNNLSLIERKISNIFLKNAYDNLLSQNIFDIKISNLAEELGWKSYKSSDLKQAIRNLVTTKVEWNIFKKDKKNSWSISTLLASADLEEEQGICKYSYSEGLKKLLNSPNIYARLDLLIQKRFGSKHALAIWEFLVEALCTRNYQEIITEWMTLEQYRSLLNIDNSKYPEFKKFNAWLIKAPLKEINELSDITATAEFEKRGRKVVAVRFKAKRKKELQLSLDIENQINQDQDEVVEFKSTLLKEMSKEFDLRKKLSEKIILKYGVEQIVLNLDYVRVQIEKGGIKNIAAYTVYAIENDLRIKNAEKETEEEKLKKENYQKTRNKSVNSDYQELFNKVLISLEKEVGKINFKNWFRSINLGNIEEKKVILLSDSNFIANYLQENYLNILVREFNKEIGSIEMVIFKKG